MEFEMRDRLCIVFFFWFLNSESAIGLVEEDSRNWEKVTNVMHDPTNAFWHVQ